MFSIHHMDIRAADLGLLLALDALLDERNVTRAAKRLNLSQPAMSAQLSRLRALFEDELLVPSGRIMVPTARASALQGPLHELLEQLSTLIAEQQAFDPTTAQRTFRIIAADYVHTVVSVPLLHAIQKIAPGVRMVLLPFEPATAWLQLERSAADVLFAWREVTPEAARAKPLYTETLCLLQRIGHPRGKGKVTIDELCSLDHITISPEGGRLSGPLDDQLKLVGRKRRVVASVPSFLIVPWTLMNSDLVATAPRRLAGMMGHTVEAYDLPFPVLSYDMLVAWHPRTHNDPGHKWLREMAAGLFGASGAVTP